MEKKSQTASKQTAQVSAAIKQGLLPVRAPEPGKDSPDTDDGKDESQGHRLLNHVLIGCTGSLGTTWLPKIIRELVVYKCDVDIRVVATNNAMRFIDLRELSVNVYTDDDDWKSWQKKGDKVLHLELSRWADVMVIAPLDANTLAKLSCGICDNLLTCVVRAWSLSKPLMFSPVMDRRMWSHPLTSSQIITLRSFGFEEIPVLTRSYTHGREMEVDIPAIVQRVSRILERLNSEQVVDGIVDSTLLAMKV